MEYEGIEWKMVESRRSLLLIKKEKEERIKI